MQTRQLYDKDWMQNIGAKSLHDPLSIEEDARRRELLKAESARLLTAKECADLMELNVRYES